VDEESTTVFRVTASGDTGITYAWSVEPPSAGNFGSPATADTIFNVASVSAETTIKIRVGVAADNSQMIVVTREVTVLNSVPNRGPLARAVAIPYEVKGGIPVQFEDRSTDPDGSDTIVKWEWDFSFELSTGFLAESSERNPSRTYYEDGYYQVMLRVTDDGGLVDMLDEPIWIKVGTPLGPPVAVATPDRYVQQAGLHIGFHGDESYDPDGEAIVSWEWDWDEDGLYDQSGPDTTHVFYRTGLHKIQLQVTDNEGMTDTLDEPLQVFIVGGWARQSGWTMADAGLDVNVDRWDNALIAGSYSFNSGGTYSYNAMFSPFGDEKWTNVWGNWQDNKPANAVEVDRSGNIYVVGQFSRSVDFDPGPIVHWANSNGNKIDAYLCKFNHDGDFLWMTGWGGTAEDSAQGIALDSVDNIYVTGYYSSYVDFDPGPDAETRYCEGYNDIYLSKFDSDGNFLWVRTMGNYGYDSATDVAVDVFDSVYICGSYNQTVDFDPGAGVDERTSFGASDFFLVKFHSVGDYLWAYTRGGHSDDHCNAVDVGIQGNVYITGDFEETVDFSPLAGMETHTSEGQSDVFLVKLDIYGEYQWTRTWGSSSEDSGYGVAVDSTDHAIVAGCFHGETDFDPGPGNAIYSPEGNYDCFTSRFNTLGDFDWVFTWGSPGDDIAYGIDTNSEDDVIVTGQFYGSVDFLPGVFEDIHTASGGTDIFVLKILSNGMWY